jgi:short-subunit dehydrogenase involved in D-alanine esterification of teichoic acids
LFQWAKSEYPELNVLINNAGIQQRTNLLKTQEDWSYHRQEIMFDKRSFSDLFIFLNYLSLLNNYIK